MKATTRLVLVVAAALSMNGLATAVSSAQLPPTPSSSLPVETTDPGTTAPVGTEDIGQGQGVLQAAGGLLAGSNAGGGVRTAEREQAAPAAMGSAEDAPRIRVTKTNDADEDGRFSGNEEASDPNIDVPFRIKITNRGSASVQIDEITDDYGETSVDVCEQLIGQRIEPSASVTCIFELQDYSPRRYDSVANTIEVTATSGNPGVQRTASAISTVTTTGEESGAQVLGETVTNQGGPDTAGDASGGSIAADGAGASAGSSSTGSSGTGSSSTGSSGDSLATTGSPIDALGGVSLFLAAAGWLFLLAGRRRGRTGWTSSGAPECVEST